MAIPRIFKFIMKYVAPAYLAIVFVGFCVQNIEQSVREIAGSRNAQLALGLVGSVVLWLVIGTWLGARRWRRLGLDINDGGRDLSPSTPNPAAAGPVGLAT